MVSHTEPCRCPHSIVMIHTGQNGNVEVPSGKLRSPGMKLVQLYTRDIPVLMPEMPVWPVLIHQLTAITDYTTDNSFPTNNS